FPVMNQTVIEIFQKAAHHIGLKRDFLIIENDTIPAPMSCRISRPVIILPVGFAASMSSNELRTVAIHELSHVKRNDVIIFSFLSFIKAVFFIDPVVWFAVRRISHLAELVCDAEVVENTQDYVIYADMLTRIADHLPKHALTTELAAGILFSKSSFFRRIEAILSTRKNQIRKLSRLALTGTIMAAIISLVIALALPLGYAREQKAMVTISGRVVYEGNPVSGANVYIQCNDALYYVFDYSEKIAKTNKDGFFSLKIESSKLEEPRNLVVFHPDYSAGIMKLTDMVNIDNITVKLGNKNSVSGIVIDNSGNPIKNVNVKKWNFGSIYELMTKTDRNGKFVINNFTEEKNVNLEFLCTGYAQDNEFRILPGSTNTQITLIPEGKISGRVVYGDSGNPAKNITVCTVCDYSTGRYGRKALTDKDGFYTLTNLHSGLYYVSLFFTEQSNDWTSAVLENITVEEGKTTENVDITLVKGCIITGTVTEKETGTPIPYHRISAKHPDGNTRMFYGTTLTEKNGRYSLRVYPGEIQVYSGAPLGYEAVGNVTHTATAENGQTVTDINFEFNKGIEISGIVLSPDGNPVTGVTITAREAKRFGKEKGKTITDDNGMFILIGQTEGTKLLLKAENKELQLRGKTEYEVQPDTKPQLNLNTRSSEEVNEKIQANDPVINLEHYETTNIEGLVLDESGNPIPKVKIGLIYWDRDLGQGVGIFAGETDNSGNFDIPDLIIGDDYSLNTRIQGYGQTVLSLNSLKKEMSHINTIILRRADRWLEGTVTDENGNPVTGAQINTSREIDALSGMKSAVSDSKGYFRFNELVAFVEPEIEIEHKDFAHYEFRFIPTNGKHDFTLIRGQNYLDGIVTDSTNNPIEGAQISIDPQRHVSGLIYMNDVVSDAVGKFRMEGIIDDTVTIIAGHNVKGAKKFENIKTNIPGTKFVFDESDKSPNSGFEFDNKGVVLLESKFAPELSVDRWINGNPLRLADQAGKIVVLDFWSKDESRSVEALELMNTLQKEYGEKGLVVIGIHEYTPDIASLNNFIREKGLQYTIAVDRKSDNRKLDFQTKNVRNGIASQATGLSETSGSGGKTFDSYGISKLQMQQYKIIIDKEGIVHTDIFGSDIEKRIRELL
ncbi:MAG: carboxypeptidase regulatory-like domain-containing protein, partial [Candidatus Latescibacteria bacterium]|nr:carboxypeptidase regulatory-like domain-containing protein [Candidatus Latescibacterota bacterium]